jgi:response regulator RpfG family c-di-GMP phosphodiesterase
MTSIDSVLIVDDEPALRDLMSFWVSSLGLRATTASSADEALHALRGGPCDLAVVDVLMPGRDGLWLATEMQRDHPSTAVIIATAYTDLLADDVPQPEIADLLIKPFQRDRFALAVERARQWRRKALEDVQWDAVLSKELRERTDELCLQHGHLLEWQAAIDAMVAIMAARAPAALEHGARVARYSIAVAREMTLSRHDIDEIEPAARLHDVGKAAMPDALLSQPSPLSPGARIIMRRHVEAGAEILGATAVLASIAPIVLSTHEWFNGGGYPRKLAGAHIPLASRIISVADAYDNMTTGTEATRDRLSVPATAVLELLRRAGNQLDPAAVAAFLNVLGRQ